MTRAHRSTVVDWASLPPELVQSIADRVLSTTGDVDAYMDMRAVCPSWRSAIARPAALADLRFRPRNWVMLDLISENHKVDDRIFLNVSTGCFRRLHLPMLRNHLIFGVSDGLLLLTDCREPPHPARVLNQIGRAHV